MMELFVEWIDGIYFPGYAEDTAIDNPEKFAFEYAEFLENFGSGRWS